MSGLPIKCRDINEVGSFCNCISDEGAADAAIESFCKRTEDSSVKPTGDELVELKKAMIDMEEPEEETDPDDCCCEC